MDPKGASFNDAEQHCVSEGGNLVSVVDRYEYSFLNYYYKVVDPPPFLSEDDPEALWIGLYRYGNGSSSFQWTNEWPVYFTEWSDNEPTIDTNKEMQCAFQYKENGTWGLTDDCVTGKPYICKITYDAKPVVPPYDHSYNCPNVSVNASRFDPYFKWNNVDVHSPHCYWVQNSISTSWIEAHHECRVRNGTLVSIHSEHDIKMLLTTISKSKMAVWIGLRESLSGEMEWTDRSGIDYTNWDKDWEKNRPRDEACAYMQQVNGKWMLSKCQSTYSQTSGFICQVKKIKTDPGPAPGSAFTEKSSKFLTALFLLIVFTLNAFK